MMRSLFALAFVLIATVAQAVQPDEILDDPTGAREMASQGARRARDLFSADAMVEGTIEVYRHLLEAVPVEEVVQ